MHNPSTLPTSQTPDIHKRLSTAARLISVGASLRDLSVAVERDSRGRITASKSAIHAFFQGEKDLRSEVVAQLRRTLERLLRAHVTEAQRALEVISSTV